MVEEHHEGVWEAEQEQEQYLRNNNIRQLSLNSLGTLTDISPLHLQSSILSLTSVSSSTELIPELEIKRLKDLLPRGAAEVFDIIHLLFSRENKSFNSVGRFWLTRIHFSNPDISVV